ncbi:YihY/virulence factor BrkB family protein [Actinopolyspora erythraea]|uniref:YihY/virulence factor BrkB family protein n=1 Tax=Actinopolyspora erythraea TaxID=414996 RepID=A0A223RUH8_9ACTN|nr:YihY/virulence factor BrkB family protein [Actinopolyspora erythraea]ASU79510.1 YihY/virulence factor BrkB family protein [Actinopolyspora erythraea]
MNPSSNRDGRRRSRGPARGLWRLVGHTLRKSWDDDIFSESAAAAFWQTLSLPPLLLGLLGSLGFVGEWLGPEVVGTMQRRVVEFAGTVFSDNVVDQIIRPTAADILTSGRTRVVSVAFLLSLWAGSSALASLIDSITLAYDQYMVRNPVWQRALALLLYLASLVIAVLVLPLTALGPRWLLDVMPEWLRADVTVLIRLLYFPVTGTLLVLALATLYKLALPRKLPWHRGLPGALLAMLVFLCSSVGLRVYITWVTSTGYTYGALATPIAFLLFAFFIGFAVVGGAQFNNAIQRMWPAGMTRRERRRWRRLEMQRAAQRLRTERGYEAWRDGNPQGGQDHRAHGARDRSTDAPPEAGPPPHGHPPTGPAPR